LHKGQQGLGEDHSATMTEDRRPAFGTWLALQLQRRDLTQADFSRITGLSTGIISNWINGSREPTARSIARVAQGLRLDETDVLRAAGLIEEPGEETPEIRALIRLLRRIDLRPDRYRTLRAIMEDWLEVDESR
jgi:transcriptional regulator with XRE-family HTH domain